MRIATYNVEWFNWLFDDDGKLLRNATWSARWDVTKAMQADALGAVFHAMDADAVMIIEAPDTSRRRSGKRALESFAEFYDLRTDTALIGFPNDTQQEIALLYDPRVLTARHHPRDGGAANPRFDGAMPLDIDVDASPEAITWSKPPLEAEVSLPGGRKLNLIGVHAKSKAPHGATDPKEIMRIAIANRRKQLAQCIWIRRRVDQILAAGEDVIVLGDFNDGPGLDEYEKLFGRSGVEIVLGEDHGEALFDPHARMALGRRIGAQPATARFRLQTGQWLSALLDYIMVSPALMSRRPAWTIWHPFDNTACYADPHLREALLLASDHFPVVLDIDL